jgi:7-carboxy-7-deazaguanine synthase
MKAAIDTIFSSISGECNALVQGRRCTFVRFYGCNLSCSYCFGIKPGRKIPKITYSRRSNKKLNEVSIGDKLLTFDQKTHELVETEVVETLNREVDTWLELKIENHLYFVTEEHPFFTVRGLVKAKDLKVGDEIYHSDHNQKISYYCKHFNPMKRKEVAEKVRDNTDYKQIGAKISKTIRKKQEKGIYISPWEKLTENQKEKLRKNMSERQKGELNTNWKGGKNKNYNFWKSERKDNKKLNARNGYCVQAIKKVNRLNYPPSLQPKPLRVYNLKCSPYNSYIIDNMWVHNCDTPMKEQKHEYIDLKTFKPETDVVCITGGEPLLQKEEVLFLIEHVRRQGKMCYVETNGTIDWTDIPVPCVVDFKMQYADKMQPDFIKKIRSQDYMKVVVSDLKQLPFLKKLYETFVYFHTFITAPCFCVSMTDFSFYQEIENFCKENNMSNVVFNFQLHKLLGLQ